MIGSLVLATTLALPAAPTTFDLRSGEVTFEIEAPLDVISGVTRGISGTATFDPAPRGAAPSASRGGELPCETEAPLAVTPGATRGIAATAPFDPAAWTTAPSSTRRDRR